MLLYLVDNNNNIQSFKHSLLLMQNTSGEDDSGIGPHEMEVEPTMHKCLQEQPTCIIIIIIILIIIIIIIIIII